MNKFSPTCNNILIVNRINKQNMFPIKIPNQIQLMTFRVFVVNFEQI